MDFKSRTTPSIFLLIPLILFFSLTACGLPNNSEGEQQTVDTIALVGMGFVQDSKGNPIPNATITGKEFSDLNGLLMSTTKTYAEGWVVVDAAGYSVGYAHAEETLPDVYVFNVRLTPFSTMIRIDEDNNQSIGTEDLRNPEIEVMFPQGSFTALPILAGVVEVNPIHVGPLFAPLSTGQKLNLQRTFALQALNVQGEIAPLSPGKTLEVLIRDDGQLSTPVTMAAFDPEQGEWQVISDDCTRLDETHIMCETDKMSPLIGIFTEQDYLWMPELANLMTGGGSLTGLMSLKSHYLTTHLAQTEGGCDGPVAEAMDQELMAYPVVIGDLLEHGGDLNSDTMADFMNHYNDLAFAYTDLCRNEKGKAALLRIMAANKTLGLEFGDNWAYDPSRVIDKIQELSREIAQKALAEGKCIDMPEALNAIREAWLLGVADIPLTEGGTETVEEAFYRKTTELSEECDLWSGTIKITHFPEGAVIGVEDHTRLTGNNVWSETHDIRISTHPETHAITGGSKIKLAFPPIMYGNTSDADDCYKNDLIVYYGFPSDKMEVNTGQEDSANSMDSENQVDQELIDEFAEAMENPQSLTSEDLTAMAEALENLGDSANQSKEDLDNSGGSSPGSYNLEYGFDATFNGFYDGNSFSISDLNYNCSAEIMQFQHAESEEDDECIVNYEVNIPVHNYSSYLVHGFYGSPPITLQEILETIPTGGDLETIRGSEEFSNPRPEVGSYPFNTTLVTWNLIHIQNQNLK